MTRRQLRKLMRNAIIGLLYRSLTNKIKPLIGKSQFHMQQDRFVRLYLKHLLSFKRKPLNFMLTSSPGISEGAGSQALLVMYAISFSQALSFSYRHTPFNEMAHSQGSMDQWAKVWENYFNLGAGEIINDSSQDNVINLPKSFYQLQYVYRIYDFSALFTDTLDSFKQKYYLNKQKPVKRNNHINVCIHIRRGDVTRTDYRELWTDPKVICNSIEQLRSILDAKPLTYELHLYSQGEIGDFAEFNGFKIHYHLDDDPVASHAQLVSADVLIMAKSTYSYVAALLGDGVMLYQATGIANHLTPLDHWVIRDQEGFFDADDFENKLNRLQHVDCERSTKG